MLPLTVSYFSLGAFLIISSLLAYFCRLQLKNMQCHGFYRFFAFTGIVWLLLHALPWWHYQLVSLRQIIALLLLSISLGLLIASVWLLRSKGMANSDTAADRAMPENFHFENTQCLVTHGVYRYIRHPMYSSLLFLALGLLCKRPALDSVIITLLIVVMLYITARKEERENAEFFGGVYDIYLTRSKMFIPAVW